jgi:hypothetical protein
MGSCKNCGACGCGAGTAQRLTKERLASEGPWRVVRANPSPTTGEWMIAGARPGFIAEVRDCGSGDVQSNAQLLGAAWSLLQSLKWAVGMAEEAILARQASDDPEDTDEATLAMHREELAKAHAVIAQATGGHNGVQAV